jgi:hypothetical protein
MTSINAQKLRKYSCEIARMNGEVSSNAKQILNTRPNNVIPSIRFMVNCPKIVCGTIESKWTAGF